MLYDLGTDAAIIVIAATAISSWVIGVRMRHKIKRFLGRKASDADLASIDTWIKVVKEEEKAPLDQK